MQRPHLLFTPSARGRRWWPGLALGLVALATTGGARRSTAAAPRPGQAYVAGQFLRAVLRGNYPDAYGRLAPEVRRSVSLARFETAARPLWKSGQQHGQRIALYQLGMRLGESGPGSCFTPILTRQIRCLKSLRCCWKSLSGTRPREQCWDLGCGGQENEPLGEACLTKPCRLVRGMR